jgi:hypothetical protein
MKSFIRSIHRVTKFILTWAEIGVQSIKKLFARLTHIATAHIRIVAQFRSFWLWLTILWILSSVLIKMSEAIFWGILGLIAGIWLTKVGNDKPVFVRSYGDAVYMIENPFFSIVSRSSVLSDRILVSLFGSSLDKILVVYPFSTKIIFFTRSPFNLSLAGAEIISLKGHKTRYLTFANSDLLYAFPDSETYRRFWSWVKARGYQVNCLEIDGGNIKRYRLGQVLTSAHLWSDPEVLSATDIRKGSRDTLE